MRIKQSKLWDVQYHWLCDPATKKELQVKWDPGKYNKADYYTKHFPPTHHIRMQKTLFLPDVNTSLKNLRTPARPLQ